MQALDMQDFEELYQKFFPAPVAPAIAQVTTPAAAVPYLPNKTGLSNTEIIVGVACVAFFAFCCYQVYKSHEQKKRNKYYDYL